MQYFLFTYLNHELGIIYLSYSFYSNSWNQDAELPDFFVSNSHLGPQGVPSLPLLPVLLRLLLQFPHPSSRGLKVLMRHFCRSTIGTVSFHHVCLSRSPFEAEHSRTFESWIPFHGIRLLSSQAFDRTKRVKKLFCLGQGLAWASAILWDASSCFVGL